jgi:hypothetical protein
MKEQQQQRHAYTKTTVMLPMGRSNKPIPTTLLCSCHYPKHSLLTFQLNNKHNNIPMGWLEWSRCCNLAFGERRCGCNVVRRVDNRRGLDPYASDSGNVDWMYYTFNFVLAIVLDPIGM